MQAQGGADQAFEQRIAHVARVGQQGNGALAGGGAQRRGGEEAIGLRRQGEPVGPRGRVQQHALGALWIAQRRVAHGPVARVAVAAVDAAQIDRAAHQVAQMKPGVGHRRGGAHGAAEIVLKQVQEGGGQRVGPVARLGRADQRGGPVGGVRGAFGVGGYHLTAVDEILPVSMELRQEHRKQGVALSVVLDRSGSMSAPVSGGMTKMDLANLGAAAAIELLSPIDAIGVIAVDSMEHVIQPLTPVTNVDALTSTVRSIESAGGGGSPFDLDNDGMVGPADLAELLGQWGGSGSADFDGSGMVGPEDLAQILGAWGPAAGGDSEYVLEIMGRTN